MKREMPDTFFLTRALLAIPRQTLNDHIERSSREARCWVCSSRDCRGLCSVGAVYEAHFSPERAGRVDGRCWGTVSRLRKVAGMSRKQAREHAASRGAFVSLTKDGESVDLVLMTDPECTLKDGFKKGDDKRTVYRVLTVSVPVKADSSLRFLDLTLYAFQAYDAQVAEGVEGKKIVTMTRHGSKGDVNTRYAFKVGRSLKPNERKIAAGILREFKAVPF